MTITTTTLSRAAGLCAVAGGLLYAGVQIAHPPVDAAFATTTEYTIRETVKIAMAVLSLVGITGMYLRHARQVGVLGLIGYLVFGAGYLALLTVQVIGVFVLPSLIDTSPDYVDGVLAVALGGRATTDIGAMNDFLHVGGGAYLVGGLLFGIAFFRAHALARWAAALLALGAASSGLIPFLPMINFRLFAIPVAVAVAGLGYSLWREQRSQPVRPRASADSSRLDPAGAR